MKDTFLRFLNKYKYHFLVWGIFIAYEVIMEIFLGLFRASPVITYIFAYIPYVLLFYFHAHVLLKYTLNSPNKHFKYSLPLLIILELLCYLIIRFLADFCYKYIDHQHLDTDIIYFTGSVWRGIYFIGISTVYYFLTHDQQQRQQIAKMKQQELKAILLAKGINNELIQTQNAFLRAQINPHFLINTLSYLYNVTRKTSPKIADNILSLTEIVQYALSKEISSVYVKLEDEIKLIESFLLLHQAQLPYKLQLRLSYNDEALPILIIPLMLMTLTENIIKHAQLDNPGKQAEIKIVYENSILYIKTSNHKTKMDQISTQYTDLENIGSRLSSIYGENAFFDCHHDLQNNFHTHTKIRFY
ncbi:histidine kinase [Pedobacter sp. PAMC26386]|nr:histidine kinase [Pedobacter sp. PAMC26386]